MLSHPGAIVVRGAACALLLACGCPLAALAQSCVPDTTPDWMSMVPMASSSAQVRPADCAIVQQTPPDLSWPDLSADATYQVTLTYPGGSSRSSTVTRNWINWDEILPAGNYAWQVQVTNAAGTQTSRARRFTVSAAAVPFLVPDWMTLFNRAAAKPRPRAVPDPATAQAMISQRQAELAQLYARVESRLADPLPADPQSLSPTAVSLLTQDESRRLLDAALAWLVTYRQDYFADAVRRALNLAAWDARGATAYASVDLASSLIAGTLALAYDWLGPWLDVNQKAALLAPILVRGTDMYNDVIGSRARVAIHPYDSHRNPILTYLAGICVLLAGDIPEAWGCVRDTVPLAVHWTSPWGGEDGGFGNGTAYATWTTGDLLVAWYSLRWVTGVELPMKAWLRNHENFLAYFVPPGAPAGAFGDGAEQRLTEPWARVGKALSLFAPGPLGRWYASQLTGEDPARLELLLAPPADLSPAQFPAGTPHSAWFPSIGWAAMHSDLADPARTSIYFRASPYGSFNHSHADQNGFVINTGGQPLAIGSGYFDDYGSPHWWQWYKQTRAHNAITFDGGRGQAVFEESGKLGAAAITAFSSQPDHDIVTGDATPAYDGALTEARRSLVYLRPNLVVVHDRLASATPRQWEWNIHAVNAINVVSDQKISIANNGQSLCVDMLAAPAVRFAQSDLFTADPAGNLPRQWHGRFTAVDPSSFAEFIALLDIGCGGMAASAVKADGVWTVTAGNRTVTIADSGITVQ